MRVPRIYTSQILTPGTQLALEPDAGHHLTKVLRLQSGHNLLLFNGDGC
jgi:16S rRNA (uracil1498-N3)-methyltransferase